MTPIEMHYSWIGFVYQATAWLGQRLAEKWFDVVLALLGTLFGYWLAKRHLEHFVSGIVEKMDAKHLDLNRQVAFRRAVADNIAILAIDIPIGLLEGPRACDKAARKLLGQPRGSSVFPAPSLDPRLTRPAVYAAFVPQR